MTEEFFKPKFMDYDDGQAESVLSDHLDIWVERQVAQRVVEESAHLKQAARQVVRSLAVLKSVAPEGTDYTQMVADIVSYTHWGDGSALLGAFEGARERHGAISEEVQARWEAAQQKPKRRSRA